MKKNGFTLIELLVTVAILAVLIILALMGWQNHLNRARDAQRKADLERIKVAFENYYNDNECFPDQDILQICDSDNLNPYLRNIPCDPAFNLPYCYIHDEENTCGQSYKILAPLKDSGDPIIEKLFCDGDLYCGYEANCAALINPPSGASYEGFNYGVTSGNVQLYNPDATPIASPTSSPTSFPSPTSSPLPTPSGYIYACQPPDGSCNSYADPIDSGCKTWHSYSEVCISNCCGTDCDNPSNWCAQ